MRVAHVSQGRRLASDAVLFALLGPVAGWGFKLIHDVEMRRGLRSLPGFLVRKMRCKQEQLHGANGEKFSPEITLEFEKPSWPAWLDGLVERLNGFAQ